MKKLILILLALAGPWVWAAPGAHGPNGEHLDAPAGVAASASSAPRFEANSETFELVGRLESGALSLMVNRFATNEPVLQAKVEVESGSLKVPATFNPQAGDYVVSDAAFLKQLATPGDHPLVITVLAGNDTDLLDGTLKTGAVPAAAQDHGHGHGHDHGVPAVAWIVVAFVVLAIAGVILSRRKRKTGEISL